MDLDLNYPFDQAVCCLCGDVGFPAKLFRCVNRCCNRFQHSYCSNYYGESAEAIEACDWCRSEERSGRPRPTPRPTHGRHGSARKSAVNHDGISPKGSAHKIRDTNSAGLPSPRPAPRRYKLLKDVM